MHTDISDIDRMLLYGAEYGNLDVVSENLKKGANVNVDNDAALQVASSNGHIDVVKYLINHGAEIDGGMILEALDNRELCTAAELINNIGNVSLGLLDDDVKSQVELVFYDLDIGVLTLDKILGASCNVKKLVRNYEQDLDDKRIRKAMNRINIQNELIRSSFN